MKNLRFSLLFFLLILILTVFQSPYSFAEGNDTADSGSDYVQGDVLVVLKPRASGIKITAADLNMGSEAFRVASFAAASGAWVKDTYANLSEAGNSVFALLHSDSVPTDKLVSDFLNNPEVLAASPNYKIHISDTIPNDTITPSNNDGSLWGLKYIGAPEAWDYSTGSRDIYVAVIDTGIDHTNPDLTANVATELGKNTINNSTDAKDDNGHGTHVAGTIGATGNNGIGIVGVNWNVGLIPIKALNSDGSGEISNVTKAIDYITGLLEKDPNLKIAAVNLSAEIYLSTPPTEEGLMSLPLWRAFKALDNLNRTVIVVAAGNYGNVVGQPTSRSRYSYGTLIYSRGDYVYPASFRGLSNMISVSALGSGGSLTSYSNTNADIAAPGGDASAQILSTWLQSSPVYRASTEDNTSLNLDAGTSMAAPHVAGAVALLASIHPEQSAYQLKTAIIGGSGNSLNLPRAIEYQEENAGEIPYSSGATEFIDPDDLPIIPESGGGSGGECNSGFGILELILALIWPSLLKYLSKGK